MNKLLSGIFHWRVTHPDILIDVDSYYVSGLKPAFLIEPLVPQEGIDWFRERVPNHATDHHPCLHYHARLRVQSPPHESQIRKTQIGF